MAKRNRKIKILDRSFPVQGMGMLLAHGIYTVPPHIAEYCVKKMRSAVYCKDTSKKVSKNAED